MLGLVFIIECGIARFLCAMCVFKVQASASSPRLRFVPNFVSVAASIAELASGEKLLTQSLNHLHSIFDAKGTEAKHLCFEITVNNSNKNTLRMWT